MQPENETGEKFSPKYFFLAVAATAVIFIFTFKTFFPTLWDNQLTLGLWPIVKVSLVAHLCLAAFEFFFHRYVLHEVVISWLRKFERDHGMHHALTVIFRKKSATANPGSAPVVNRYPITQPKQYESSFFPYWGLAGFTLFFSPFMAIVQWFMPHTPVILGSFVAIVLSYCLYELLHALEHVPYDKFWRQFVESPVLGKVGKKVYGFHQFHHANVMCNMAISGFFGLPVFDWLFGTYKQPRQLLLDGTLAVEEDFSSPRPCWLIRLVDNVVKPKAA